MLGSASFVGFLQVLSSKGRCLESIFGCELLFLDVDVGLVFFDDVLPRFWFYVLGLRSRKCAKNSLNVRFFVFPSSSCLFLFFCFSRSGKN